MNQQMTLSDEQQQQIGQYAVVHLPPVADRLENVMVSLVDDGSIPYTAGDSADHMALAFVTKQREHFKSVRLLLNAEMHRDALLIARIMVEGSGMLRWAFLDIPTRTDLWLWFGAIRDYRQILKNAARGAAVDPNEVAELKRLVDLHGPNYYRPEVRKAIRSATKSGQTYSPPSDPWRYQWHDVSVKDMFQEINDTVTYEKVYRNSSEWIHWDPRTILRAMELGPLGTKGFSEKDWNAAGLAFPQSVQSLLECLRILDQHFALGLQVSLDAINTQMLGILNEAVASVVAQPDAP